MFGVAEMLGAAKAMEESRIDADQSERQRLKEAGLSPFEVETIMVERMKAAAMATSCRCGGRRG